MKADYKVKSSSILTDSPNPDPCLSPRVLPSSEDFNRPYFGVPSASKYSYLGIGSGRQSRSPGCSCADLKQIKIIVVLMAHKEQTVKVKFNPTIYRGITRS